METVTHNGFLYDDPVDHTQPINDKLEILEKIWIVIVTVWPSGSIKMKSNGIRDMAESRLIYATIMCLTQDRSKCSVFVILNSYLFFYLVLIRKN